MSDLNGYHFHTNEQGNYAITKDTIIITDTTINKDNSNVSSSLVISDDNFAKALLDVVSNDHMQEPEKNYSDDFILESFYSSCIGDSNLYQYTLLIITIISVVSLEIITVSIAYFEVKPTLNIQNKATGLETSNIEFDYKYCNNIKYNIEDINYPKYSIISEFGFYCDKNQVGFLGSTIFLGVFLGALFLQLLVNAIGKKLAFIVSTFFFSIFTFIAYFNTNKTILFLLFFAIQFFSNMSYYIILMFLVESCKENLRSAFSSIFFSSLNLCAILFSIIYWYIPNWRMSMLIVSFSTLVIIVFTLWYAFEHPRYYYSNKNIEMFLNNCASISKRNGKMNKLDIIFSDEYKHYLLFCYSYIHDNIKIYENLIEYEKNNNSSNEHSSEKIHKDNSITSIGKKQLIDNNEKEQPILKYKLSLKEMNEIKDHINEESFHNKILKKLTYIKSNIMHNQSDTIHTDIKEISSKETNSAFSTFIETTSKAIDIVKTNKADETINKINVTSSKDDILHIRKIIFYNFIIYSNSYKKETINNDTKNKDSQFKIALKLITYPSQRKVFLALCFKWFIVCGIYYSVNILLKNLVGSLFLNTILLNSFEMCIYIITSLIADTNLFKRKGTYYLLYSLTIISSLSCFIFNIDSTSLIFTYLILFSRLLIAGLFGLNITYSLEFYPFTLKTFGFGLNNVAGTLSSVIFPVFIEMIDKKDLPLYISGSCVLCMMLVIILPETIGKNTKDNAPEDDIIKK